VRNHLSIRLEGTSESFKRLVQDLSTNKHIFRDPGHPLANFIAEIEDQLEDNADPEFDFIDLDEVYSDV
jgi:hypothetical protein